MTNINPAAKAAQHQARRQNGEFGQQAHSVPELIDYKAERDAQSAAFDVAREQAAERWGDDYEVATVALQKVMLEDETQNIRDGNSWAVSDIEPGYDDDAYFRELDAVAEKFDREYDVNGISDEAETQIDGRLATFMLHDPEATDLALSKPGGARSIGSSLYMQQLGGSGFRDSADSFDPDVAVRLEAAHVATQGTYRLTDGNLIHGDDGHIHFE